jgi:hypothetical protein
MNSPRVARLTLLGSPHRVGSDNAVPTAGAAPGSVLAGAAPADPGAAPSQRSIGRAGIRFGVAVVVLVAIVFVVGRLNHERAVHSTDFTYGMVGVVTVVE